MKRPVKLLVAAVLVVPSALIAGWLTVHMWSLYVGSERYYRFHRIEVQPLGIFDPWSKVIRISDPWSDVILLSLAAVGIASGICIARDRRKSLSAAIGFLALVSSFLLGGGSLGLFL